MLPLYNESVNCFMLSALQALLAIPELEERLVRTFHFQVLHPARTGSELHFLAQIGEIFSQKSKIGADVALLNPQGLRESAATCTYLNKRATELWEGHVTVTDMRYRLLSDDFRSGQQDAGEFLQAVLHASPEFKMLTAFTQTVINTCPTCGRIMHKVSGSPLLTHPFHHLLHHIADPDPAHPDAEIRRRGG